jgi:AraC-like DNA-binding protein
MYRLYEPAEPLRPFIENYWFVSSEDGEEVDLRVDVFVDARADLVFNFAAPYEREVIGSHPTEVSRSNLDAQRLVPIRIRQRGEVRIAGVRFRLGGMAPVTRERLDRWSGLTPDPSLVFGDGARELEAGLRGDPDPASSGARLDAFFLDRFRRDDDQLAFERALDALIGAEGRLSLGDLADAAAVSPRRVERLFARSLGFPPRTVGRVLRFQHALRRLMVDPGVPLGDVAAESGYYDQAHFVRDFREFTGGVPRGYRGYYPPGGPDDFAPNVVAFVQDAGPAGAVD